MKKKLNNTRVLNSITPHFNDHITVINNSTNLTLCLICKDSLANEDPNTVSTHVLSPRHKHSLKNLFEMCVFNDVCDQNNHNYMNMITSNLVFDISILLGNDNSYIHRYENHIVCLICKDIISEVKGSNDDLKDDICTHLHGEQHLNNIKNNVCWVYKLKTVSGFLMFYKSTYFCSVCHQTYQSQKKGTVQNAAVHLAIDHPDEINKCCNVTKVIKQTQQDNIGNYCLASELSEEKNNMCVLGKTNDVDLELTEVKILKGNPACLMRKIEIRQQNNANPLIVTNQFSKTYNFCVVCKDTDTSDPVDSDIESHLSSLRHKENLESLIYQCIPDPFCEKNTDKYNEVVFVLNNSSGCIIQSNSYLVCLICKNLITNINQSLETIKYDLAYHFGTNKHLSIMRENVWWFYYLQFSEDFVSFDNHVSCCTNCTSYLESIPHRVVQCVKEHLQTENVMLIDRTTPEMNPLENTTDCGDIICSECKETVDIYNNDPEFSMNLHFERHRDLHEVNNRLEQEISENTCEEAEYTCPVCFDKFLIFNRDIELSISLHGCNTIEMVPKKISNASVHDLSMVFNSLPDTFRVHKEFITLEGNDFGCKLCNCSFILSSSLEDACKQVQIHILEYYHKEQYNTYKNIATVPKKGIDKEVDPWVLFNNIDNPDTLSLMNSVIDQNREYIGKCKNFYFCKICKCCFLTFGDTEEVMKIFASHFLCKNHKKKFRRYVNNNWSLDHNCDEITSDKSNKPSLSQPVTLKESNRYIFNMIKSLPAYQLNSQYFAVQGNSVHCTLCNIFIPCDKINHVRKHCYSEEHSMILVENASKYVMNHEVSVLHHGHVKDPCNNRLVVVLKTLAESHYRLNDPSLTPNLMYIDIKKNNFYCLICKISLPFSLEGSFLVNHFQTKLHKQRTFDLNCSHSSNSAKDISNWKKPQTFENGSTNSKATFNNEKIVEWQKEVENGIVKVTEIFEKLPEEFSIYRDFVSMDGKSPTCILCDVKLLSKNNFEADCKTLQEHMSSLLHKEQFQVYKGSKMSNEYDQFIQKDPWERFEDESNFEICLEAQQLIKKNKENFEKGNIYFMCYKCDAYFLYFDEENMTNTFASHCLTIEHARNFKQKSKVLKKENNVGAKLKSQCLTMKLDAQSVSCHSDGCDLKKDVDKVIKKPRSNFALCLNQHYFRLKDNQPFCDICQVFIKDNGNESNLRRHCYSQAHNIILTKNSIEFVEGLVGNRTFCEMNRLNSKFPRYINTLKKLAKASYKQRHTTLLANLFFISCNTRKFCCLLCDKKIPGTEKCVIQHITSNEHATNVLKLNCILHLHNSKESNSVKELSDISNKGSSESRMNYTGLISDARDNQYALKNVEMDRYESLSNSIEDFEALEPRYDDLISHETKVDFDCTALEETCSNSYHKSKTESEDEDSRKASDVLLKSSEDCDDYGKGIVICDSDLFDKENKSESLNWDFVDIKVSTMVFNENVDYVCPDCNEVITIIEEDIISSFKTHYKACHSNIKELFLKQHELVLVNKRFVRELFDCLPEVHEKYMENINVQNETLFCSLCKSFIETEKGDIFESAIHLHFHLSSKYHKGQELYLMQTKPNHSRFKLIPEIQILANKNAPQVVKQIFSEMKILAFEGENTARQSIIDQEKLEESIYDHTPVLTSEVSNIDEVSRIEYSVVEQETQFCRETNRNVSLATNISLNVKDSTFFPEKGDFSSKFNEQVEDEELTLNPTLAFTTEKSSTDETGGVGFYSNGKEAQISNENRCNENLIKNTLHEKYHKICNSYEKDTSSQDKFTITSCSLTNLFKAFPENLLVHQEFFTINENKVTCKLCSLTFHEIGVKTHLTDFAHRRGFLSELKRRVEADIKAEVKHLLFVNNQLYCGCCRSYITPWSDFYTICQSVSSHLKVPPHLTSSDTPV